MKRTIIIFCLLAFTYISNAQNLKESDVPAAVKNAFTSMYPSASAVKWEMENTQYEASSKKAALKPRSFEENGTYVQTEVEIAVKSLPVAVDDYLSKNVPGKKIKEAAKITDAKGTVTFEAEAGGTDYLFDANGGFLKKDSDGPDDKDDDDNKK
jgi:hypothetical protein